MGERRRLQGAEVDRVRIGLPGWAVEESGLRRVIACADFSAAFGLMCRIALLAEKLDHHPDWSNSYSTIDVRLTTHDLGGLSTLDVALAEGIDRLLA